MTESVAQHTPIKILVVDDEENLRHVLGTMLTQFGYAVIEATTGRTAIEKLDSDAQIRLVLCDMSPGC